MPRRKEPTIYKWLVTHKTRGLFASLSEGDAGPFLATIADDIVFTYPGSHVMAGTMRSKDEAAAWFERFFRFFPGIRFTVTDVTVNGAPWSTTSIAAEWTVQATLANGYEYENEGVHIIRLRNGKAVEIQVYLDSQKSAAALESLGESGSDVPPAETQRV